MTHGDGLQREIHAYEMRQFGRYFACFVVGPFEIRLFKFFVDKNKTRFSIALLR